MPTQTSATAQLLFAVLMFATGIGIPTMAALNAGLGGRIGSPIAAGLILSVVGGLVCAAVLVFTLPGSRINLLAAPPQFYAGGALMAFYVLSITIAAPRIGIGNAVFFVLLGQLVAAATIDHFGLFGSVVTPITVRRTAGIAVMAIGVFLARKVVV